MAKKQNTLRAIDLYSGVGGWSLGLNLAGIEVVASYERWGVANETNFKNNRHQAQTVDIRRLALSDLPNDIDIVVGSPPCTQFSFSNRGGSGDIADGLQDIVKFLTIVDHLKPKLWAMENVPRVAQILEKELRKGGRLWRFRHLGVIPHVVNMEDFGLPQRRRRCIAGNFDFALLRTYAATMPTRTLGVIVKALAAKNLVVDPIYGIELSSTELKDHITEDVLNSEEVRINKAAKVTHTVYNAMSFPDGLERSVRTITATCTRVSRESIVIENPNRAGTYRRLTIRERACLQGFPINFQFYGESYSQKIRMIGNAVPPAFAYLVAQSLRGTVASKLPTLADSAKNFRAPDTAPPETIPDRPGSTFSTDRRFRFAIPSLQLKSGVRFELVNRIEENIVTWAVDFYFGTSKSIESLTLDRALHSLLLKSLSRTMRQKIDANLETLVEYLRDIDITRMQQVWSHRGPGGTAPFSVLDRLEQTGSEVIATLSEEGLSFQENIENAIKAEYGKQIVKLTGLQKLYRNSPLILAGLIIGSLANTELSKRRRPPLVTKHRYA